jgi:hypothetical protein
MIRVKSIKALDNYELEIEFTNSEIKVMDMKPFLDIPIYKELKDPNLFNKLKVAFGTIQWENGADFDPDSLYNLSTEVVKELI